MSFADEMSALANQNQIASEESMIKSFLALIFKNEVQRYALLGYGGIAWKEKSTPSWANSPRVSMALKQVCYEVAKELGLDLTAKTMNSQLEVKLIWDSKLGVRPLIDSEKPNLLGQITSW